LSCDWLLLSLGLLHGLCELIHKLCILVITCSLEEWLSFQEALLGLFELSDFLLSDTQHLVALGDLTRFLTIYFDFNIQDFLKFLDGLMNHLHLEQVHGNSSLGSEDFWVFFSLNLGEPHVNDFPQAADGFDVLFFGFLI